MNDLYTFTVPVFIKMLGGLRQVLEKAQAAVDQGKLDEQKLMESRIAPDMFPFPRQVQIACDNAKGSVARLSGSESPKMEDNEKSIKELMARVDKTVSYVQGFKPESFANAANVQATLPYFPGKYMMGFDYAREYAIPNFFFHLTIAYALVRQAGVEIGKSDYITNLPFRDL